MPFRGKGGATRARECTVNNQAMHTHAACRGYHRQTGCFTCPSCNSYTPYLATDFRWQSSPFANFRILKKQEKKRKRHSAGRSKNSSNHLYIIMYEYIIWGDTVLRPKHPSGNARLDIPLKTKRPFCFRPDWLSFIYIGGYAVFESILGSAYYISPSRNSERSARHL